MFHHAPVTAANPSDLAGGQEISGGAAWVRRFLQPLLVRQFHCSSGLRCLQLAPDDPSEAAALGRLGHRCEMTEPGPQLTLAFPDAAFDLVFTGHFTARAPNEQTRMILAREICRVLRPGGALLLLVGNRWCPLDLSRNGPLLHGPRSQACLTFNECLDLFQHRVGFGPPMPLRLNGHFGWASIPGFLRPLGLMLDVYWRFVAVPSRKWLYTSPLNPTLLLWLKKR